MIRPICISVGEDIIAEAMAFDEGWPDIVQSLAAEGLNDEEIASLLRQQEAWTAESREMKAAGYQYEEIIFHLTTLRASWADAGRALMAAGLPPADMLRAVLPCMDGEDLWPIFQAALVDGPEDGDYGEVRGVLDFFLSESEVFASLDGEMVRRERVVKRLGIQE